MAPVGKVGKAGRGGAGPIFGLNCTGTAEVFTQDGWKLCKINKKKGILDEF